MSVANNADDYANARVGIFFPGFPDSLTGQCVSLDKWFLAEMTSVPNPQAARGNAKDFGDNLVNQGYATQVAESDRKRGDIVVWKQDGGGYGHIAVLLSGDRVFEENVGLTSSTRGEFGGNIVYASRIDPLYQNWRKGAPTFYRINSYSEQGDTSVAIIEDADNWRNRAQRSFQTIRGRDMGVGEFEPWIGQDFLHLIEALEDSTETDANVDYAKWGRTAKNDNWQGQIGDLQTQLAAAQRDTATDEITISDLKGQIKTLQDQIAAQVAVTTTPSQTTVPTVPVMPANPTVVTPPVVQPVRHWYDWWVTYFSIKK